MYDLEDKVERLTYATNSEIVKVEIQEFIQLKLTFLTELELEFELDLDFVILARVVSKQLR